MAEKIFNKGDIIFREGDFPESFYQLESGSVGIFSDFGGENEQMLTGLDTGQFFGEMGIIEQYPRSATAVALTDDTRVIEISSDNAASYFEEDPGRILQVMKHLSKRLRELTADYEEVSAVLRGLYPEEAAKPDEGFFGKLKKFASVFSGRKKNDDQVSAERKRDFEGASHSDGFAKKLETYPKGTVICREGQTGNCMYDVHWGKVGIFTGYGTANERKLTDLMANNFFGEMGMIDQAPRSATAVVLEDETVVEIIYPEDLEELFKKNPAKINMILSHLSSRLRSLTKAYLEACELAYEADKMEAGGVPVSEEFKKKLSQYEARY